MNRRGLKDASRQCLRDTHSHPKSVTLLFLLAALVIAGLDTGLGTLLQQTAGKSHSLSQSISATSRSYILVCLVSLVCQLLLVLLGMGYTSLSLRLSRREDFDRKILLEGFTLWGKTLLLYIAVSLLMSLWATAFSIPVSYVLAALDMSGVISDAMMIYLLLGYMSVIMLVVSYRYRMAQYVLLDNPQLSIRQVLARTKAINKVHRWELFLLDLSFVPWYLLCLLTLGILFIWKLPYLSATYAHAYNYMVEDFTQRQARLQAILDQQRRQMGTMQ